MKKRSVLLTMALLLSFSSVLLSNGIGIVNGSEGIYLTLLETDIQVEVNNQIARIKATQKFRNDTGEAVEIKYGFPLHENANPISLRWLFDGTWKEASVTENTQDSSIPGTGGGSEQIDPNLESYLGNTPLFFMPNDTIPGDSVIVFELEYVELLPYFLGKVSFDFKNDYTGIQFALLDKQSFSFVLNSEREILDLTMYGTPNEVNIEGGVATASVELYEAYADFDYEIEYELSSEGLGVVPLSTYLQDSIFECDEFGNGYLSLILEPESNVNTEVIQKNFTFIIDRSGSMSGDKIEQARDAATFIVENLNFGDKFNIIGFNTEIHSLFNGLVDYNVENKNMALEYIESIYADAGTNISGALTTAISEFQVVDPNKANIILFFTDGKPNGGIEDTNGILEAVQNAVNAAETSIFLFSFGIGEDVRKGLLTALSQENNGLVKFVDDEDLEEEITTFFLSINNPVLLNTEITFEPDIVVETYPYPYPNLYKGQQLILSGRYMDFETINMHLEGQAFNVPVSYDFEFNLSDTSNVELSVLPKIWAKQKMDALTLDYYLEEDTSAQAIIQNEIDSISICYGVVSVDFTSFDDDTPITETTELITRDGRIQVRMYPLPFDESLFVELQSPTSIHEDVQFKLFDLNGKCLYQVVETFNGQALTFSLNDIGILPSGTYLLEFVIQGEAYVIKVVKQ